MPRYIHLASLACLLAFSNLHAEESEECDYAVDLADSHDFEAFHECKGKDSGINRAMRELMTVRREQQTSAKSSPVAIKKRDSSFTNSAIELRDARFELLRDISKSCPKGFSVLSERYLPDNNNRLSLQLDYRCSNGR